MMMGNERNGNLFSSRLYAILQKVDINQIRKIAPNGWNMETQLNANVLAGLQLEISPAGFAEACGSSL